RRGDRRVIYLWGTLGWLWSKRKFFLVSLISAVFFFAWFFPFSDLSDVVTSTVARATNSQIYVQFETLDLNLLPTPAVSAKNVSVDTPALPELHAKWMKLSPSWTSIIWNIWTIKKAGSGDAEAAAKLGTRIGANVSAEGLLGADVDLKIRPGSAGEQGAERSKVSLFVEKLNLSEFQKWSDLPVKIQGQASIDTTIQFAPGFTEQPEGEVDIRVKKFNLPASTIMVPSDGAVFPINVPTLTLENVVLRGRLSGGKFIIEEGTFGQSKDPISGRIKGNIAVRLQAMGPQVVPQFGAYNLNVELNTSKMVDKEISFAFFIFDNAKTPTATGSHYLFTASGQGFGPPPTITRIGSF
ncbi:MAG: hypothetical protein ACXVB1_18865, partial [Pseudobdellovibrionaceae bacterium]